MRVLADRYELIAPLGRGTMGTVWRAHDRSLGREVAIKEIRQEPGLSEAQRTELRERMIREGRMAARISHPSVATIHDAIVEDGSPWIIMELVQARSLERVIEEEGPLPPRLVAEIGVDLLGALRAAHAQGVLHRDVKPGNVLITESGRVVLTDFGIAKAQGDTSLTRTGMVIGSPGYTAPERARGEHTGPESDLWSLGATLYFAVEGRPAYERSSVSETLAALMSEQVDPPTQAGPLRPVLEQLLNRDYKTRLTAAQANAILRAVADTPSHLADSTPAPAPVPPASQTPRAAAPTDEGYDADRTMMIIRPKGGLRIPGSGPAPGAEPPAPASPASPAAASATPPPSGPPETGWVERPVVPGLGRPVAGRPSPPGPPGPGAPTVGRQGPPSPPGPGAPTAGRQARPGPPGPGTPAAGRQGPPGSPGLGTPVAGRQGPPGAYPQRPPEGSAQWPPAGAPHGFSPAARPDLTDTPPHGFPTVPGQGAPLQGQQGPGGTPSTWQPDAFSGNFPPPPGLGTDLFAIAGQGGPAVDPGQEERKASVQRKRTGIFILMGVAVFALFVIMVLVMSTFT
ncbi:Serine/threonine protein kinase [Streptosporangium subroseum]|uniref:non-specific serine/threonine protein kinase n=2 Tax=Streptosporangium subroseum TaxID=106412 RepID=A0A239NPK8_9ACTN|nr:Serine/threonine protein kinase [Streptosporangium subroseum]